MWSETQFLNWANKRSLRKSNLKLKDINNLDVQIRFPEDDGGYLFVSSRIFSVKETQYTTEERLWSFRCAPSEWELGSEFKDYTSWNEIAESLLEKCTQIDPNCRVAVERETLQKKYTTTSTAMCKAL